MTPLLSVRGLYASYSGQPVLHGLDFDLAEGEAAVLLGPNGAGKTTTLRALCGMTERAGAVHFDGVDLQRKSTDEIARLKIAHVPEGRGTLAALTVEENLSLGAITRSSVREIAADMERVYADFPVLSERRRQQAGTLSGGEQQMLAIARALMLRPRLMLLDEPSFGLAPAIVSELLSVLDRLRREEAITLLLVEQNADLALGMTDHAYVLEAGVIVRSGPSTEMRADAGVRRFYLGG